MGVSNTEIFQIYFDDWHKDHLSSRFTPLLNTKNDGFYEVGVMRRAFKDGLIKKDQKSGFVSWRFEKKSGLKDKRLLEFCQSEPTADICILNPFPELIGQYRNVWLQGAESHPGLLTAAQRVFDAAKIPIELLDMVNTTDNTSYCNYWCATYDFWQAFMDFVEPFFKIFEDSRHPVSLEIRGDARYQGGATFIPFFLERLVSTFLVSNPHYRVVSFKWTPDELISALHGLRSQLNLCEAKLNGLAELKRNMPRWKKIALPSHEFDKFAALPKA
jgi:hypothetical protein